MQLAKGRFVRGDKEKGRSSPDAFDVRSILDIHHLEIEFNLPVGIQPPPLAAAAVRPRIASHWTGKDERARAREREREREGLENRKVKGWVQH